jgi:hypothetical protein
MSLLVTNLVGFGCGDSRKVATVSYAGLTNSSDLTDPTLTVPIGDAATNRSVLAIVYLSNNFGTLGNITSATIGGVACTKVATIGDISPVMAAGIFVTNSPIASGTTASMVLSADADNAMAIATFAAYGILPAVADILEVDASDPTGTIDVPAGGILIAGSTNQTSTYTCTWTGVTEVVDVSYNSVSRASAGTYTTHAAVTGRTVTANWSTSNDDVMVAASWGPA